LLEAIQSKFKIFK